MFVSAFLLGTILSLVMILFVPAGEVVAMILGNDDPRLAILLADVIGVAFLFLEVGRVPLSLSIFGIAHGANVNVSREEVRCAGVFKILITSVCAVGVIFAATLLLIGYVNVTSMLGQFRFLFGVGTLTLIFCTLAISLAYGGKHLVQDRLEK